MFKNRDRTEELIVIGCIICAVLFWGNPDLHDVLIAQLSCKGG